MSTSTVPFLTAFKISFFSFAFVAPDKYATTGLSLSGAIILTKVSYNCFAKISVGPNKHA